MEQYADRKVLFTQLQERLYGVFSEINEKSQQCETENKELRTKLLNVEAVVCKLYEENEKLKQERTKLEQELSNSKRAVCQKCCNLERDLENEKKKSNQTAYKWKSLQKFLNEMEEKNDLHQLMTEKFFGEHEQDCIGEDVAVPGSSHKSQLERVQHRISVEKDEVAGIVKKELDDVECGFTESEFFSNMADEIQKMSTCIGNGVSLDDGFTYQGSPVQCVKEEPKERYDLEDCEGQYITEDRIDQKEYASSYLAPPIKATFIIPETVVDDAIFIDEPQVMMRNERTPYKLVDMLSEKGSPVFKKNSGKKFGKLFDGSPSLLHKMKENENIPVVKIEDSNYQQEMEGDIKTEADCANSLNNQTVSSPLKIVTNIFLTPTKRKASQLGTSKSPTKNSTFSPSPKRKATSPGQKRLRKKTPNKKGCSQLKKSNMVDAEIGVAGVRRLKQTKLNLECFKTSKEEQDREGRRKKERERMYLEDECMKHALEISLLNQCDRDEDVILESPNGSCYPSLKTFISSKVETEENEMTDKLFSKTGSEKCVKREMFDPDETNLTTTFINKISNKKTDLCKRKTENFDITYDRLPQETEEDIKFPYVRGPVRKKADRMKLPGQECLECAEYYKLALGSEYNTDNLKKLMNKCSRHRDKQPVISDTPEGFWKPYLTSTLCSENELS